MNKWFTVEEIYKNTFAISEYGHWEETHSYLLIGQEKALLIDTGLGVSNIELEVRKLTNLPVLVVTTHAHWDHIGGHKYFENIGVHFMEEKWLSEKFPIPLSMVKKNLAYRSCQFPMDFNIEQYTIFKGKPQFVFSDREKINIGGRVLEVIHTPGHSPGHCCFYEEAARVLFTGDLVYKGTLDAFYPSTDPVLFWKSIQKIKLLEIKQIFPGHHKLHIPVSLIQQIDQSFSELSEEGKLEQGRGLFDFGEFQIHI